MPRESHVILEEAILEKREHTVYSYYVLSETFKTELCSGYDSTTVARVLVDKGYMKAQGKGLQVKARLPGLGLTNVYQILPTILESACIPDTCDQSARGHWADSGNSL